MSTSTHFFALSTLLFLPVLFLTSEPSNACTTFLNQHGNELRIGKSYDWDLSQGLILFNKKGVSKRALLLDPGDTPATWTSKYANLTFNQYGREMPNGGINTEGLVVEIMWLNGSRYSKRNELPALTELQWIQYLLDNAANIEEAIALARKVRVSRVHAYVHYLACDRFSRCAAFEYIDRKLVIYQGEDLPVPALTNHTYADSMNYYSTHKKGADGGKAPPGMSSLARFVRAFTLSQEDAEGNITAHTFSVLDSVRNGTYTKWQIVYDPQRLVVAFRTLDSPAIKTLSLQGLSTSCEDPVLMMNLDEEKGGPSNERLLPYRSIHNLAIVKKGLGSLGGAFGPELINLLSRYPESLTCVNP